MYAHHLLLALFSKIELNTCTYTEYLYDHDLTRCLAGCPIPSHLINCFTRSSYYCSNRTRQCLYTHLLHTFLKSIPIYSNFFVFSSPPISRKYNLRKVMVDGDIPPKVKKDAHAVILEFIRSRPPLRKVSSVKIRSIHCSLLKNI